MARLTREEKLGNLPLQLASGKVPWPGFQFLFSCHLPATFFATSLSCTCSHLALHGGQTLKLGALRGSVRVVLAAGTKTQVRRGQYIVKV